MLEGNHIKLRALEPEDAELLFKWENDYELWKVSNTLKPFSMNMIKSYIENEAMDIFETKQLRLMVDLLGERTKTIGMVDLFDFDPFNSRAGVGIMIHKDFRSNGHALDTLNVLCNYSFIHLNVHQLHCIISVSNEPSLKLFKKAGFIEIGLQKDWIFNGNEFEDVYLMQKINPKH
ncbi:MAG: GNAT family N-acetyltransferase [Bacteroidales bacterium]|nr:GNAT family N-acetyltransferase [Bacteroidales bacterium]